MSITITARRQVFDPQLGKGTWRGTKVCNIDDHQLFGDRIIEEREDKVRASQADIDHLDILGER